MEHFLCVTTNLDVLPLLYAVSNQPHLWNQDPVRTTHPGSVHSAVSDILAFFQRPGYDASSGDVNHECEPRPAWWALPELRPLVFGLSARVLATRVGRVMITRLPPGKEIPPHRDHPAQTAYYNRFHIILCSPPECVFQIEEEQVCMRPGECWRVDNSKEHAVYNQGSTERWSLIVDLHVPTMAIVPGEVEQGKAPRRRAS